MIVGSGEDLSAGSWKAVKDLEIVQVGPEACDSCALRVGLGTCVVCTIRAHRAGGADGLDRWIPLAIAGLEGYLSNVDRERLVAWARGCPTDLDRIHPCDHESHR